MNSAHATNIKPLYALNFVRYAEKMYNYEKTLTNYT